jgi:hypothetical protein
LAVVVLNIMVPKVDQQIFNQFLTEVVVLVVIQILVLLQTLVQEQDNNHLNLDNLALVALEIQEVLVVTFLRHQLLMPNIMLVVVVVVRLQLVHHSHKQVMAQLAQAVQVEHQTLLVLQ